MAFKIIQYFNQYEDNLKELLVLAMMITFIIGNLTCYNFNKIRVKFDGGFLKQDQATTLHGGIVNFTLLMR